MFELLNFSLQGSYCFLVSSIIFFFFSSSSFVCVRALRFPATFFPSVFLRIFFFFESLLPSRISYLFISISQFLLLILRSHRWVVEQWGFFHKNFLHEVTIDRKPSLNCSISMRQSKKKFEKVFKIRCVQEWDFF